MKAHLINTHLLVPRSRSSAKVKVKYQDHFTQKMGVSAALMFHKQILFSSTFYLVYQAKQTEMSVINKHVQVCTSYYFSRLLILCCRGISHKLYTKLNFCTRPNSRHLQTTKDMYINPLPHNTAFLRT